MQSVNPFFSNQNQWLTMSSSVASNDAFSATSADESHSLPPSNKHKRPSVRSSRPTAAKLEQNTPPPNLSAASAVPRSILRTSPKYTSTTTPSKDRVEYVGLSDIDGRGEEGDILVPKRRSDAGATTAPVVRERVAEKPRRPRARGGRDTASMSKETAFQIEGYSSVLSAPMSNKTDSVKAKEEHEPLVFNALSDMMAMAGTLPSQEDIEGTPQVIEAELNFSVYDPEEYNASEEKSNGNMEHDDDDGNCSTDDHSEASTTSITEKDPGDFSEDDDDVLWSAMTNKSQDEEDEEPAPPPRAFLLFWKALAQWVTPAAVAYLDHLRSSHSEVEVAPPPPMANDVAVARYHAILAMLHVPKMAADGRRRVEHLLRRMDFSRPTPKFTSNQWQGLSAIVVDMVQWNGREASFRLEEKDSPPPACQELGMTWDEYRYLVQSSIPSFR